ncbi:MAG: hypothetical protein BMS9Abin23_0852 [Thermodesulfobacteriota bacterium]|nr:MAG: hypothetical protein BMS9Abin23_0852 [Thermodesulfobacteriota bacterium]
MSFFSELLPGVSAMANIHPLFVHFPIALLNAFLLAEILNYFLKRDDLRAASSYTLYLGTLGAAAAVLAGFRAASTVGHVEGVHAIMETHEHFGLTILGLSVILSIWRLKVRARFSQTGRLLHLFFAFVLVVIIAFGADLGGLMVYKYGVSVKAVKVEGGGHDHNGAGSKVQGQDHGESGQGSVEKDHVDSGPPHDHQD